MPVRLEGSAFIFQNILALTRRENTQCLSFFCRLQAAADIKFPIDIVQVFFYRIRRNEQLGVGCPWYFGISIF